MSPLPARLFSAVSNTAWSLSASLNAILPQGELPSPSWAPGRLLKSSERMQMITGVPRRTLSLCPDCNIESTEAVIRGQATISDFKDRPGVIEAEIVEEAGRILMRKACPKHGPFEDVLSNHPAFFKRMESLAFGRDFECLNDRHVHDHGPNGIRSGHVPDHRHDEQMQHGLLTLLHGRKRYDLCPRIEHGRHQERVRRSSVI